MFSDSIIMENIKKFLVAVTFTVSFLILITGCNDDSNVPTTPNYPPNIFADVSGAYNLNYKGLGKLFITETPKYGAVITSFYTDSIGTTYYLGLNIYFPKGELTTGTFPIVDKPDTTNIYAAAFFETGKDDNKRTFLSYSGEITITEVSNVKIRATFKFLAKDAGGNNVMIENGNLYIAEQ